ncbi:LysR family transcriptional regulator [Cognatiyoonia sp. IB215182]|uniref:LysR family transcriptional regulator n=1 Tax=Cognatiyoonia sp. IB215182 TaxID=3097353 RepID=UPI002A128A75|nr:LysR family transcriptional regulator [Cognatiyoonia sp. IB215182]MDX8351895.1 LysR family transcriptional regulator [Cognatiyoonia sp. IB215182]
MDNLNYHHLRYFREVAHDGNLTRTAARVNLSQSALSTQIKQLEARLGHDLFQRVGRKLELTEVGRIVLDHADRIFGTGAELLATLDGSGMVKPPLRVGALSTLSRNFQMRFLAPLLTDGGVDLVLKSGSAAVLFSALKSLALDVVLTTEPPQAGGDFTAHRLAEQVVALHGTPERLRHASLKEALQNEPLIVPTDNAIRIAFDSLVAKLGVTPRVLADVDDMAMVRLLARANAGLAVAPTVVLADEFASGRIVTAPFDLKITEAFFAVTIRRSFPHPLLADLLAQNDAPN